MLEYKPYGIVMARTVNSLMNNVNHRVSLGFDPIGGLMYDPESRLWAQALYKKPDEDDDE